MYFGEANLPAQIRARFYCCHNCCEDGFIGGNIKMTHAACNTAIDVIFNYGYMYVYVC